MKAAFRSDAMLVLGMPEADSGEIQELWRTTMLRRAGARKRNGGGMGPRSMGWVGESLVRVARRGAQ